MNLGEYLSPLAPDLGAAPPMPGTLVNLPAAALGPVDGPGGTEMARSLRFYFEASPDLRLVSTPGALNLTGSITVQGSQAVLALGDAARGVQITASGPADDPDFMAQQAANKINFALGKDCLPVTAGSPTNPDGPPGPIADPVRRLRALGHGGPVDLALDLDKSDGASYKTGDTVTVLAKVTRDCNLMIDVVDQHGSVTQIFPNQAQPDGSVQSGATVSATKTIDVSQIDPDGAPGQELVVAVATLPGTGKAGAAPADFAGLYKFLSLEAKSGGNGNAPGTVSLTSSHISTAVVRFFAVK